MNTHACRASTSWRATPEVVLAHIPAAAGSGSVSAASPVSLSSATSVLSVGLVVVLPSAVRLPLVAPRTPAATVLSAGPVVVPSVAGNAAAATLGTVSSVPTAVQFVTPPGPVPVAPSAGPASAISVPSTVAMASSSVASQLLGEG